MGNVVLFISKIIFNQETMRKNYKYVFRSLKFKDIQYTELGIFTQWNVLNIHCLSCRQKDIDRCARL